MSWAALFERAGEYDATTDAIARALRTVREGRDGRSEEASEDA
jgi:hypothetical protein